MLPSAILHKSELPSMSKLKSTKPRLIMNSTLSLTSPSLRLSSTPITPRPLPVDFLEILENWRIPNLDCSAILPSALQAESWTDALLEAVRQLSSVTVGQRERAHSLLNTYMQMRVREGSYRGKNKSICTTLEVQDVEQATLSVRRMSKGQALEYVASTQEDSPGKRKYSIRNETESTPMCPPGKLPRIDTSHKYHDMSLSAILAPTPTPTTLPVLPSRPLTPAKSNSRQKRPIRLPPIKTRDINTPTLPVIYAYTNRAVCEDLIQAAQRATHEFNLKRMELDSASVVYEAAKRLCSEAARRMDQARSKVSEWK